MLPNGTTVTQGTRHRLLDKSRNKFWDEFWTKEAKNTSNFSLIKRSHSTLLDSFRTDFLDERLNGMKGKVLEVGCGSATMALHYAFRGWDVYNIDLSKDALCIAKKQFTAFDKQGHFKMGDARAIPYPDNYFDLVISAGALEYVSPPEKMIAEMTRVLKSKGVLFCATVPRKTFTLIELFSFFKQKNTGARNANQFTRTHLEKMVENLDGTEVVSAGLVPPPLPFVTKVKLLNDFQMNLLYFLKPLWKYAQNSWLAERFGLEYYIYGRKSGK